MADSVTITSAPKPPIRTPFFDFIGDERGALRRQLGQISREWLIYYQQEAALMDQLAAAVAALGPGGADDGSVTHDSVPVTY